MDQGKITEIVTPTGTFRNTANDKFLMQIEFGMAKKYVDDLSDNVKRGNRAKLSTDGCQADHLSATSMSQRSEPSFPIQSDSLWSSGCGTYSCRGFSHERFFAGPQKSGDYELGSLVVQAAVQ